MDDIPTPLEKGWSEPAGVSLTAGEGTVVMDLPAALAWAGEHNATLRFSNNPERDGEHSVRVTVNTHHPGDRTAAVHHAPDGESCPQVLARAISQVREHWEATDPRRRLRPIAGSGPGLLP